jgi:uncharacterized protein YggU (UPF0235/DUF167 family)
MPFWRAAGPGVTVRVKVQPGARRPGLGGARPAADGPRLALAVAEAPEDGRANRAACRALAEALGVPPSDVAVAQGAGSREKLLRVAGDAALLGPRLEALA